MIGTDRSMDLWVDGSVNGQMDRQTEMDRQIDG